MNVVSLKNACVTASFLVAVGHANIALAHEQIGALGAGPGKTDHYTVTCSSDSGGTTDHLATSVHDDTVGAGQVSVQTVKGIIARNITDPIEGDGISSPVVHNWGGDGAYTVLIDKSGPGENNYRLTFHCETATGVHTGTGIVTRQNQ